MDYVSILMTVAASLTALGIILMAVKKTALFTRRVVHLIDVVVGSPGVDGLPDTPGISARLSAIEAELRPNGGGSLKDQINRLETWTTGHSIVHADLNPRARSRSN